MAEDFSVYLPRNVDIRCFRLGVSEEIKNSLTVDLIEQLSVGHQLSDSNTQSSTLFFAINLDLVLSKLHLLSSITRSYIFFSQGRTLASSRREHVLHQYLHRNGMRNLIPPRYRDSYPIIPETNSQQQKKKAQSKKRKRSSDEA
jgi:hypothetical protein